MVSEAMFNDLRQAYDATRDILALAVERANEYRTKAEHQANVIAELRRDIEGMDDELYRSAQQIAELKSTILELRTELAETKQAALLGILAE